MGSDPSGIRAGMPPYGCPITEYSLPSEYLKSGFDRLRPLALLAAYTYQILHWIQLQARFHRSQALFFALNRHEIMSTLC